MNGTTYTSCVCVRPADRRRPRPEPRSRETARRRRVCKDTHGGSQHESSLTCLLHYTTLYRLYTLQRIQRLLYTVMGPVFSPGVGNRV